MDDGGFLSPAGRCRRIWGRRQHTSGGRHGRQYSVERALSASTLLPTTAFAALSAMTVLVVTQIGISPLSALGDPTAPSARDGGLAVTSPRMSISIAQPFERPFALESGRGTIRARISPAAVIAAPDDHAGAGPAAPTVFVAQARSVDTGATEPFQYSAQSESAQGDRHGKAAHDPKSAKPAKPKPATAVKHLKDAKDGKDAKTDKASHRVEQSRAV